MNILVLLLHLILIKACILHFFLNVLIINLLHTELLKVIPAAISEWYCYAVWDRKLSGFRRHLETESISLIIHRWECHKQLWSLLLWWFLRAGCLKWEGMQMGYMCSDSLRGGPKLISINYAIIYQWKQNLVTPYFTTLTQYLPFLQLQPLRPVQFIYDRLQAGQARGSSTSPNRGNIFLFFKSSNLVLGPTWPPIQWVLGALCLEVKQLGCEADHSSPTSAKFKNIWIYTSTPSYVLVSQWLISWAQGQLYPFTCHAGCNICKCWASCQPVSPGGRKPISVSSVTELSPCLSRHILAEFCFQW
jgi:hypothetical protein